MATVIPFPAERLDDPAEALFLALMRSADTMRGEVIALAARRRVAQQDNAAQEQEQEAQAVPF